MAMNISRLSLKRLVSLSNQSKGVAIGSIALVLAACGGDSSSGGSAATESDLMVSTYDDLPVCSSARDGAMAYVKDKKVTYVCVDGDWTLEESSSSSEDDQPGAVKDKSISGVSQKGPFLKGTTVTAYELDGSKSLLQTGRTFSGSITQDDGRFNLSNVTLKSSYVRLSANGFYRNEVTGENSKASITLNAVTDLSSRNTVNVNLLTHLEFDRVSHLMAESDGTLKIKDAKKQAEKEIFDAFHIDAKGFGYSEDLDVFGNTEADAALLAISILLQGDRTESDLTELLAELSVDLSDGKWDDDAMRAEIADWALDKDDYRDLADYRNHVNDWELTTTVPHFEKYIRRFASLENGLGLCGSDSTPIRTVKQVSNDKSKYYAESYTDTTSVGKKTRYVCVDADSAKWRKATDLEKDRFNWKPVNTKDGSVLTELRPFSGRKMVWDADTLRYASLEESSIKKGCVSYIRSGTYVVNLAYYDCTVNGWKLDVESSSGIVKDANGKEYRTIAIGFQNWMAENLNFKTDSSFCYNNEESNCAKYGRLYTWNDAKKACPSGWHLPTRAEFDTLIAAVGGISTANNVLRSTSGWNNCGNCADAFGFSALPAGYRYDNGNFRDEGYYARFWSSTEYDSNVAYDMHLNYNGGSPGIGDKLFGSSVRCLQD